MLKKREAEAIARRLQKAPPGPWYWTDSELVADLPGGRGTVPILKAEARDVLYCPPEVVAVLGTCRTDLSRLTSEVLRLRQVLLCLAGAADEGVLMSDEILDMVADGLGLSRKALARELGPMKEDEPDG